MAVNSLHGFPVRMLNGTGVGMVASRARSIEPGTQFDMYFPRVERTDPILTNNGENWQTIDIFMPQVISQYKTDTKQIANVLKRNSLELTLKAITDFVYRHIQYKLDSPHEEQIRRPARTWADRREGVDCDCYTVFISSILCNLAIPHSLRMTGYNPVRGFQHIYIVVPKFTGANLDRRADYWAIDLVMDGFNEEKPYHPRLRRDREILKATAPVNGLSGFPIRMLNGSDIPFAKSSGLVYTNVYYHPEKEVWALKGLDGAYYIQGEPRLRYVEPAQLSGTALGFIDTAIKVAGGAIKVGKALFGKRKKKGGDSAPAPAAAAPSAGASLVSSLTSKDDSAEKLTAIDSKLKAVNSNTVMSLNTVDKGLKARLHDLTKNLGLEIAALKKDNNDNRTMLEKIKDMAAKSLALTSGANLQNSELSNQNADLTNAVVDEQSKSEQFRKNQKTMMIIIVALIAVAVLFIGYSYIKHKQINH